MARIKSLKALGKGAWKVVSISPVTKSAKKLFTNTDNMPQAILWRAVQRKWPEAIQEHPAGVPGRKFRIDIAFVEKKLAIEQDGYQFHGKFLADFKRDRSRQNLLVIYGWRVLRFTAADVHQNLQGCLTMIEVALASK